MSVMDLFDTTGKVVIVTGASSGLGVSFARGFAEAGADVVLAARRAEKLADTAAAVEELGRKALVVPADVADPEQCQRVVDAAMETFGKVDVLIAVAGAGGGLASGMVVSAWTYPALGLGVAALTVVALGAALARWRPAAA